MGKNSVLDDVWNVAFTPNALGLTDISLSDFGSSLGGGDKKQALQAQQQAAAQANATQTYIYNQSREDQAPWRQAGQQALGQMQNPNFQQSFGMNQFQADPGYQFRMSEGMKAIQGSAAAKGSLNSGATLKSLQKYGQNLASDEYNTAFNRFQTDQTNRFNRLSTLAGTGQTATNQVQSAGQNYGNNVANTAIGMGNAQAAYHTGMGDMYRGYGQMGMSALAMCDERLKTNIQVIPREEIAELRKTIKPYIFNYLNEEHGTGDWVGPMAQDLEKSKLGRTIVVEDARGNKQIDLKKAICLILATMAEA